MGDEVILTCALVGSIITGNPNQPQTRDDVIRAGIDAAQAGATVLHIHSRTIDGEATQSPDDYRAIKGAIRAAVGDILINFTTGGGLWMTADERRRSLEAQPDIASLNCGTINFGPAGDIFMNPQSLIDDIAAEMDRRGVIREYECFDIGMAVTAARLARTAERAPGMMHLVMGVVGGAPATVDTIRLFTGLVPDRVPWMVTAIGRHNFPMMAVTLALGGHIRTGLEDVVYSARGEYAESNAALVVRARALCEAIGRPVATPAQAREILGIAR